MSAARPEGDPADRVPGEADGSRPAEASYPRQDRRSLVDLTRVEAGEPERRAPFRRFTEADPEL